MSAKILITALMALMTSGAFADQMGPHGDKFYEEAARFETACAHRDVCLAPYSKKVVYEYSRRYDKLDVNTKAALKLIAYHQAQIWGDTILEGDYHAAGRTRLDHVLAFYKGDQVVGYKIQYSEKAWYTGSCDYDGTRKSLADCTEGRITEGSYVSPDKETYFSDEDRYANFQPQTF